MLMQRELFLAALSTLKCHGSRMQGYTALVLRAVKGLGAFPQALKDVRNLS